MLEEDCREEALTQMSEMSALDSQPDSEFDFDDMDNPNPKPKKRVLGKKPALLGGSVFAAGPPSSMSGQPGGLPPLPPGMSGFFNM